MWTSGEWFKIMLELVSLVFLSFELTSSEYLRLMIVKYCRFPSICFCELTLAILWHRNQAHCQRIQDGRGLLWEPQRQRIFLQPRWSQQRVQTWLGWTSLSSFEIRKNMEIFYSPCFTIYCFRSMSIKLICSFFFKFCSMRSRTVPYKNSGSPVLALTISLTSCLKLQKGLSNTIFLTFLQYRLAQSTAVTAPIDLPQRLTFSTPNLSCTQRTTLAVSLASFNPIVTYSPSLTPEPEQSNRQTMWPYCNRYLQYSRPQSRDPLFVCKKIVTSWLLSQEQTSVLILTDFVRYYGTSGADEIELFDPGLIYGSNIDN